MNPNLLRAAILPPLVLSAAIASAQDAADMDADVTDVVAQPSVLLPQGQLIFEPGFSYSHGSSLDVAIEGHTVIPALVIGLINVSESQRDTFTTSLGFKYGLTRRLQLDLTVPYVYREERIRDREILEGSSADLYDRSFGDGIGDLELALRYQLNNGQNGWPFLIANLRVKSHTGEGPLEVNRRTVTAEDEDGNPVTVGEVLTEQPTGSGFWAVQPSLTFILPSDPVVLFGSLSYLYNVERKFDSVLGEVDPGDSVGFSLGMGIALNDRTSFSLGYDHNAVMRTEWENDPGIDASFDRYQVGSFIFGLTHRFGAQRVNVSLAIGATENAPDVQMGVRVPFKLID